MSMARLAERDLKKLQEEHGRLPKTVTVKTGKGRHLYFRCADVRVSNSAGRIGKGIDVRGDGGYVVAAGSIPIQESPIVLSMGGDWTR